MYADGLPLLDHRHSRTGVTFLMCAAARGRIPVTEQLLLSGADVTARANHNWTARDFALCHEQSDVVKILDDYK